MESVENVEGDPGGIVAVTSEMSVTDATALTDPVTPEASDTVAIPPEPDESTLSPPTKSPATPIPPTTAPIALFTPKRQIKLATSNSSAAAWFATGPISSKKKDPDIKETPPVPIDTTPQETGPQALSFEELVVTNPELPVVFSLTERSQTVVHPMVIEESDPTVDVLKADAMGMDSFWGESADGRNVTDSCGTKY